VLDRLVRWCDLNTHTRNLAGIHSLMDELELELRTLGAVTRREQPGPAEVVDDAGQPDRFALAPVLIGSIRPDAAMRVLLGIHVDTVYPVDHPFQTCRSLSAGRVNGPGVADAKGGLLVMIEALRRFEQSPEASSLGWDVFVNGDEEIGSPGSASILAELARGHSIAMVYEPSLPDGALVRSRKGSGTFSFVVHGKAAHAGRDFHAGRNAVIATSRLASRLHDANADVAPAIINVGAIRGGGAVNVVPDRCVLRINCRTDSPDDEDRLRTTIHQAVAFASVEGIRIEMTGGFSSPPRPLDERSARLLDLAVACGRTVGLSLDTRPTGGACDGNRLAAAGLAVLDSLGVQGGALHSPDEYVEVASIEQRIALSVELLRKLPRL
jgi:glutamate carboxypeptidase